MTTSEIFYFGSLLFLGLCACAGGHAARSAGPAGLELSAFSVLSALSVLAWLAVFGWGFHAHRWWLPLAAAIAGPVFWTFSPDFMKYPPKVQRFGFTSGVLGVLLFVQSFLVHASS